MLNSSKIFVIFLIAIFSFSGLVQAKKNSDNENPSIGMVTGQKSGTYIAFGKDIAQEVAKDGITVNVFESNGSINNIERITSKEKVGLAIVQSDVLSVLGELKNPESIDIAKKMRLVAPFYDEEVHILASREIKSIEDLAGKKVLVGSEGSGSMITAANIFKLVNVKPANLYQKDLLNGMVALLNKQVDALIFVGGKPLKIFKNMEEIYNAKQGENYEKLQQLHFLALNDVRLLKDYKSANISSKDYSYVTEEVPTISVTALLVTYDYTMKTGDYYKNHCDNMQKFAKSLFKRLDDLKANGHPKWKEVDLTANISGWKRDECSNIAVDTSAKKESLENSMLKGIMEK
ncbi:MAG: TAXI family TRAP transporter solute-binding subunit [Pseudomonadota bacterium]